MCKYFIWFVIYPYNQLGEGYATQATPQNRNNGRNFFLHDLSLLDYIYRNMSINIHYLN